MAIENEAGQPAGQPASRPAFNWSLLKICVFRWKLCFCYFESPKLFKIYENLQTRVAGQGQIRRASGPEKEQKSKKFIVFFNIWAWNHWKALCFSTLELEIIEKHCVFQHLSLKSLKSIVFFNIWAWNLFNHWAGWPAGWLAGRPAGWLAGWPAGWPAGWKFQIFINFE